MLKTIIARLHQGHRTTTYPREPARLPELFRGYPRLNPARCPDGCRHCLEACPCGALSRDSDLSIDLGLCLFCSACSDACLHGAIAFTTDHRLAVSSREELVITPATEHRLARQVAERLRRLFGRSLKLREVSAGGCNACEADTNVLATIGFDLSRFGIQFVASPRHADGIFITGPVTANMELALMKTWEAIPGPKLAIASGACAIGGGPFRGSPEQRDGVGSLIPIDLYIPGCPPHPFTILDGLLRLVGQLEGEGEQP